MAHLTGNFVDALFMGWESELLDLAGDDFDEERRMFEDLAEDEDEDEWEDGDFQEQYNKKRL